MIGIEGLDHADLAEYLASAADLAAGTVLQHEHVHVPGLAVLFACEALLGSIELGDQGRAIRRQVREAAARQLRHFVDGAEILAGGRPNREAHAAPARRRTVSALKAARSASDSAIKYSSALWILPPRTPIVSTTGTPQAAILLPSQTPPDGCQEMLWPRSAPACLTSSNRASASGVSGLGARPNPPWTSIRTSRSAAMAMTAVSMRSRAR